MVVVRAKDREKGCDLGNKGRRWEVLLTRDVTGNSFAQLVSLARGCGTAVHKHDCEDTVYYIIAGSGVINGSREIRVRAGDVIYIPRLDEHGIRNVGCDDLVYFEIRYDA